MVADFDAAYEQYRAEQAPPPPVESVETKRLPIEDYLKDYRFSLAVFIPLILVITIVFWSRHHNKAAESVQSVAAVPTVSENRLPASSSTAVDVKATQSPASSKAAEAAEPATKSVAANPAAGISEIQTSSRAALKAPEMAAEPKPKQIRLEVHANQDSWMSVIADGKTMMEGVLPATGTRKFRAKKNIYFTTGNAGGVELSYNGRALPSLGTSNEVKSLTFTSTSDGPRQ